MSYVFSYSEKNNAEKKYFNSFAVLFLKWEGLQQYHFNLKIIIQSEWSKDECISSPCAYYP